MAEEFVDLYEVLELPVDADRNTLRKKINELYLDAQRNLDHRTFATRVRYQELFEVTLPQARYILLDDGRRDEYNRLVHAYRAAKNGTPVPPQSAPEAAKSSFALEPDPDSSIPGSSPRVDPLPSNTVDPEQLAKEREELWKKWKTGLEEALVVDEDKPKARSAATSAPSSFSVQPSSPAPSESPVPKPAAAPQAIQASVQPAPAPATQAAPKPAARPKVDISFDFSEKNQGSEGTAEAGAELDENGNPLLSAQEIEKRRTEHRRQIMKELLVNVGLIWGLIGAALVIVPGFAGLIFFIGKYYPRNAAPLLKYSPNIFWTAGFLLIGIGAFFASRELSKFMRRKKASELSFLSYEDLLKRVGKV